MDCSKTEIFLNEWYRMCDSFNNCSDCPFENATDKDEICETWVFNRKNFKEAIKLIQEWSDSHPVKTRLSVLKENFPNYRRDGNGEPEEPYVCAKDLFGDDCQCNDMCMECWSKPIEG